MALGRDWRRRIRAHRRQEGRPRQGVMTVPMPHLHTDPGTAVSGPPTTNGGGHMHSQRGGDGRFERKYGDAERDADAAHLRAEGKTYQAIADALGYGDRSTARKAVQRALLAIVQEAGDELR